MDEWVWRAYLKERYFISSPDDVIELVEFGRNHVDSFRMLEIKVAAVGTTLKVDEKEHLGLSPVTLKKRCLKKCISTEETNVKVKLPRMLVASFLGSARRRSDGKRLIKV